MIGWAAIMLAGAVPPSSGPLHLEVRRDGDMLVLAVTGESAAPVTVGYALEVDGGARGASNRSVQRGTARLQPGRAATVATLRLGNPDAGSWTARLHVAPSSGSPYDVVWHSPSKDTPVR